MLGWLLVGLVVALTPIAWASPTDPSWINGVYDDGDFDDVVVYLTSGTIAIPALLLLALRTVIVCLRVEPAPDERFDALFPFSPHVPRAPPAS